jgi:hypothetical protein
MPAVGDLGQRVEVGGALQRVFRLLVVRDVVQQADIQGLAQIHGRQGQVHAELVAAAVADRHFARAVVVRRVRIGGVHGEIIQVFLRHQGLSSSPMERPASSFSR